MHEITRRSLGLIAVAAALSQPAATAWSAEPNKPSGSAPDHDMSSVPAHWHGKEEIAFLAYPQFTALDLVGPHYMLGSLMGAKTHIVAKTRDPVVSDMGLAVVPSMTFEECPRELDIVCVPGGSSGTLAAMRDAATLAFLEDRGGRAKHVTSVCTGSLLLGAAGLLKGYRATSHWVARDLLAEFGATPVDARVVVDRNRITGAGVTAGLDFGLQLVSRLRDADYARAVQLLAEYHPEPPFDAGTPERAGQAISDMMAGMFTTFLAEAKDIAAATRR